MPNHEHVTVTATLVIEVDGHCLVFVQDQKATGSRYQGDPPPPGYEGNVLEANIRAAYASAVSRATQRADVAVGRLYPAADSARGKLPR